jgi:hypothetical protein
MTTTKVEILTDDIDGEFRRIRLPEPLWSTERTSPSYALGTGIYCVALYRAPRSGRYFITVQSQWMDKTGRAIGEQTREIDQTEFLRVATRLPLYGYSGAERVTAAVDAIQPEMVC